MTCYASIMLALIGMIAGMVVPHFLHGRQLGVAREEDERSICMSNLREIYGAAQQWALDTKQGDCA